MTLVYLGPVGLLGTHTQKAKKCALGKVGTAFLHSTHMSSGLCSQCRRLLRKHVKLTGTAITGVYLYLCGKHA